ncbi:isopentenyl-diphosphate Delta-isomerase [Cellulomonas cellasea]|uniref:isopentenyl-diphosphate Delta-isomerase n=1 Tax=Cellulomonas cellasea TaxID=43670 RepID=UPI0025A4C318|nr:isopentenyl-diphosphate Delta-isomerase [Cellulomonas cellasea]MDM8084009.1 isopentenyl-diphosphate Delta-isomerase [Cellulomonas cellasea]
MANVPLDPSRTASSEPEERVVLLDEAGNPIGSAPKATVHTADTPLHLAFSCYVFDADGLLLMTRRAVDKKTFPGVWTNSCCGHPGPGESIESAIGRRLEDELGITRFEGLRPVIPEFRYRAQMGNGIVENEICPVYAVVVPVGTPVVPDPTEVEDHRWVEFAEFRRLAQEPGRISPWATLQVADATRWDA